LKKGGFRIPLGFSSIGLTIYLTIKVMSNERRIALIDIFNSLWGKGFEKHKYVIFR